jgi:CRP-like cAMP-binding protein
MSSPHPLAGLVRHLEMRVPLSPEDQAAVLGLQHQLRTLEPATYLIREGDPPTRCGVLVSGFTYRQKQTSEGHRQIVALNIPGEPVDLQHLFLDVADHSVQMLTRGQVAFVPRGEFQSLIKRCPTLAHAVIINILVEGSIFREWVLNVGRRDARARMAHLMCEFAIRLQAAGLMEGTAYELPITQEQLADALGLTAVHVNRTLKGLEADGLIERRKRTIAFPSWEDLREVADFNSRYLHLGRQGSDRISARH